MSRKCYLIEEDFNSLEDPDSSARNELATARQALLLKFFGINAPRGATKGEVADMLARLEPTKAQLIDYHSWKAEGCPNISQWRRRFGRQNKISWKIKLAAGFFVLIGLAMHFSQGMRKTNASSRRLSSSCLEKNA